MFATEDLMLKYFHEQGRPLTLTDLMSKFDNSTYEDNLETVTILEKKNLVKWAGNVSWIITDIGNNCHKPKDKINYQKWSFWIGVILGTAIALVALLITIYKK